MKLSTHAGWAGYALRALAVVALGMFLLAAVIGQGTIAVLAGCICVVATASAMGLLGGSGNPEPTHRRDTPRLL